jgi:hypothetical protein
VFRLQQDAADQGDRQDPGQQPARDPPSDAGTHRPEPTLGRVRRWRVYAISGVAVAAVVLPAFTDEDSFPLSNYPMFSYDRGRVTALDTAVGVTAEGARERLSPEVIAGGYEVIHASRTVSKAIHTGDAASLCAEIAGRADDDLVAIEVVTETYDTIRWFDGEETPIGRVVHATCETPT